MEIIGVHPARRPIVYFLCAIAVGTILLLLPMSTTSGSISFINALFTATSAVCVTGLVVLNTATDFTRFGQVVIMILIQLGAIGIMTFATMLIVAVGSRLSFHDRLGLSGGYSVTGMMPSARLLRAILIATFSIELIGAVALYIRFSSMFPAGEAAFQAVFHSISAFCNAGFSTFPNNLESFNRDLWIIAVFSLLIICGGLGFVVITELFDRICLRKGRLSLHTRLCLTVTAVLLVGGTIAFVIAESDNIFSTTGIGFGVANCFFQSVTARTAGFDTISQPNFTEVSLLITLMLMFIGACPGSTAGGIKTTTIAVIFLLVYNRFLGRRSVSAFRRSISQDSITRALTVALLAALVIIVLFALLMFAEERPVSHRLSHGWFVDNLFEMISAFGTVGLSLGRTTHLHTLGKIIIVCTMFIGRVGLLTLAFGLARPPARGEIVYVDENVMVG